MCVFGSVLVNLDALIAVCKYRGIADDANARCPFVNGSFLQSHFWSKTPSGKNSPGIGFTSSPPYLSCICSDFLRPEGKDEKTPHVSVPRQSDYHHVGNTKLDSFIASFLALCFSIKSLLSQVTQDEMMKDFWLALTPPFHT